MTPFMEASIPVLEARGETPPLAAARMRRKLTVESAAKLAAAHSRRGDVARRGQALSLPLERRRANGPAPLLDRARHRAPRGEKAGRPSDLHPAPPGAGSPGGRNDGRRRPSTRRGRSVRPPGILRKETTPPAIAEAGLPPTWKVEVDILNGSGDMNYTRSVASKIGAFAYGSTGSHAPTASTIPRPRSTSIRAARSSPNGWPASSASPRDRFRAAEPRSGSSSWSARPGCSTRARA